MHNRLTNAPNHGVERRHSEAAKFHDYKLDSSKLHERGKRLPGGFVDEGDGRGADNTESQWEEESHKKDHERVEAAELVLAEREEGNEGGADVNSDGGEQAPDEHLVPNFWK